MFDVNYLLDLFVYSIHHPLLVIPRVHDPFHRNVLGIVAVVSSVEVPGAHYISFRTLSTVVRQVNAPLSCRSSFLAVLISITTVLVSCWLFHYQLSVTSRTFQFDQVGTQIVSILTA